VGKKPFKERLDIIRRLIIDVRNKAVVKGLLDESLDPFSIRNKDFWDLSTVEKVGKEFRFSRFMKCSFCSWLDQNFEHKSLMKLMD
jgi:hypothetical protein